MPPRIPSAGHQRIHILTCVGPVRRPFPLGATCVCRTFSKTHSLWTRIVAELVDACYVEGGAAFVYALLCSASAYAEKHYKAGVNHETMFSFVENDAEDIILICIKRRTPRFLHCDGSSSVGQRPGLKTRATHDQLRSSSLKAPCWKCSIRFGAETDHGHCPNHHRWN